MDEYVREAKFPADRNDLERIARQNNAPQEILDRLRELPDGTFESAAEVNNAFGTRGRTTGAAEGSLSEGAPRSEANMGGPSGTAEGTGASEGRSTRGPGSLQGR